VKILSRDQTIGGAIWVICVLIAVFYAATLFYPEWLALLGFNFASIDLRFWVVAVPVFLAFVAIMGIGAWIGWTMATTPSQKPIEEITAKPEEKTEEQSQN
jgi:predicted DNA-binding transcriptional regulator